MSKLIFRTIGGRTVPMRVDEEHHHAQRSGSSHQIPKQVFGPETYATDHAFVNPNARCSRCGAKVYYYEHPNGARVLFDHLGPPWPKHHCYEAGQQAKQSAISVAPALAGPCWKKNGWEPLFHEQHVMLQSGDAVRLQARTKRYRVRFEIPAQVLRHRHIQIDQVNTLLMQAKVDHGKVRIQIHDGQHPWEIVTTKLDGNRRPDTGVAVGIPSGGAANKLSSKSFTDGDKQHSGVKASQHTATALAKMQRLADSQLKLLTKLDGACSCSFFGQQWRVQLSHRGLEHDIFFREKAFAGIKPFIHNLEAWVGKPTKHGNRVVYLVARQSRYFITAVITAQELPWTQDVLEGRATVAAKAGSAGLDTTNLLPVVISASPEGNGWRFRFQHGSRPYELFIKNKAKGFEAMHEHVSELKGWLAPLTKGSGFTLYLQDPHTGNYLSRVFSGLAYQAVRLEKITMSSHSATCKLICGLLGEEMLSLKVDDRLFRLGETASQFAAEKHQIYLRPVQDPEESEEEFALYIHRAGEAASGRPRGYVSQLERKEATVQVSTATSASAGSEGQSSMSSRALAVTLRSLDLREDNYVYLLVADQQQEYRLGFSYADQTIRSWIAKLVEAREPHTLHLVPAMPPSYQLYMDGKFITMAGNELTPEPPMPGERSKDVRPPETLENPMTSLPLSEVIQQHDNETFSSLGAALLKAAKSTKR